MKGRLSIHWSTLENGETGDTNNGQDIPTKNRNKKLKPLGSGHIYIFWKHVTILRKQRNDAVLELYKQSGMSEEHHTIIRTAIKEL